MCGIAGYSSGVQAYSAWLSSTPDSLHHRGPDHCGIFEDQISCIGLAHTRLSIQDTSSAGHQPMISSDGRVVLIFNGEIYNVNELRGRLLDQGYCFNGNSDTEVLLNLYLDWRSQSRPLSDLLKAINGIFAFSIWDSDLETLFVVRDAFGVKPLYYFCDDSSFVFASEIKALSCFLGSSSSLDPIALDQYLTFLWAPGERTPSSNIKKVLPGEYLSVKSGRIVDHQSWYNIPTTCSSLCRSSRSLLIRNLQQHLRAAVHRQMISDVPVGSFLSGGLDSSSLVTFARELDPDIRCFTIEVNGASDEGFSDDLPYARRVAQHLGVSLDVVEVDAAQMAASVEEMVWHLDEPLADPASLNVLYISRLARDQGIKVMLSGAGGDDLFTGYRRHLAVRSEAMWSWLPSSLRGKARRLSSRVPVDYPLGRRLRKVFSGAHLEGDARLVNYFRWIDRSDLDSLFTPDFRAAKGKALAEDPMISYLEQLPKGTTPLHRMLALDQRFFLADHNLNYTDKMSMAVGVEVRVPFLDLELVDFAADIPLKYKQRGTEGKWILKKAMEPFLPKDVIYRPKTGFGAPLRRWLRVELRDWLTDTLSPDALHRRGLFDPEAVQNLIASNFNGSVDASYTLFSLACIEIWCRRFIDSSGLNSPPSSV